jgi:hypothetical protein
MVSADSDRVSRAPPYSGTGFESRSFSFTRLSRSMAPLPRGLQLTTGLVTLLLPALQPPLDRNRAVRIRQNVDGTKSDDPSRHRAKSTKILYPQKSNNLITSLRPNSAVQLFAVTTKQQTPDFVQKAGCPAPSYPSDAPFVRS